MMQAPKHHHDIASIETCRWCRDNRMAYRGCDGYGIGVLADLSGQKAKAFRPWMAEQVKKEKR